MKITKRFDGFGERLCITDECGTIGIGDNYDYGLGEMTHIAPVSKIKIITGKNCGKCKSLKNMIHKEGLDDFVEYEDIENVMVSAEMTSIPIMKCGMLLTCDYGEIFRFFRWLKSNT